MNLQRYYWLTATYSWTYRQRWALDCVVCAYHMSGQQLLWPKDTERFNGVALFLFKMISLIIFPQCAISFTADSEQIIHHSLISKQSVWSCTLCGLVVEGSFICYHLCMVYFKVYMCKWICSINNECTRHLSTDGTGQKNSFLPDSNHKLWLWYVCEHECA